MSKKIIYTFFSLSLFLLSQTSNAQVTRMPLMEEFTSSTCGPCAANNPTFDAMCDANEGIYVCVKYQMSWPGSGDIYFNNDGNVRRNSYGVNSIPTLFVDGLNVGQPAPFTATMLQNEAAISSQMIIDAHWSMVDSVLTVYGNITAQTDFDGNNRRYIAVVERHTYNNVSSNGETEFSFVEQKVLPNSVGVYTSGLTTGAVIPFTQTIDLRTVTNIENYDNLMFAVWVQNSVDKNVRQAAWATFPTGVQSITTSSNGIVSIAPNPSTEQTMIQYQLQDNASVSMTIVNSLGQLVSEKNMGALGFGLHTEMINTDNLAAGIYYIDMKIGNNHYRQPIVVE